MAIPAFLCAFVGALAYASFFEWTYHRYVLHRRLPGFRSLFVGHAQEHHGLYRGDDSFFLGERAPQHLSFSPLAWALFPITDTILATPVYFLFGPVAAAGFWVGTIFYLVAYEYLHYRMHVPAGGWLENLAPMRWNRTRHLLHHQKHFTNMNVVIPIADLFLGTLRTAPADHTTRESRARRPEDCG